ncbi:MAG: LCP family protein [Atopobiaceae bacterium]|nr:LCP family protein [Atopobiaceae bacterium]
MDSFEDLRRGSFHPDANAKAAEQEAGELSRGSYVVDANAKAAEQEAIESLDVERGEAARGGVPRTVRRGSRASSAQARPSNRDLRDHTVIRRTTEGRHEPSGGAVISKRSGVGAYLRRRIREQRSDSRSRDRAAERARKQWEREQRRTSGKGLGAPRALIGALVAIVALYLVFCLPIDRAISFSREESAGLGKELSWHVPGMPYYVLALGSDAREGETVSRSDTMILVRVDTLGGKLTMLSIPRDTMVEIEGYGTQKINAAYAFGGAAGAVRAVHELTGAPISQVALVRFDGVKSIVDYLGGVTVNVPVDVYDPEYTGLILPAGEQHMDGETALLFSRVRHGFDLGDYQRQKDQRILMEAVMREALSLPVTKMPGLVSHMGGMLGTTMRMYSILPLLVRLKLGGGATIYQATVPSTTAMVDGISYVVADDYALSQMMDVIDAGGDPAELQ